MIKKEVKIFLPFLFFFFVFFLRPTITEAATKYWIGSSGGSFNSNSNWSTTNGGSNDTTAPGASDIATFTSSNNNNSALDSTVNVAGISIQSGYTGNLIQSAGVDVTVGSSNFTIAGGTYTGSTGLITISGAFTQSGGTFVASSATTTIKNTFTKTTGTFTHNSGTVAIEVISTSFTFAAGSATFYNFTIWKSQSTSFPTITITNSLTVANDFKVYNMSTSETFTVQSSSSLNPTITVQGNAVFPNGTSAVGLSFGSATAANNFTLNVEGNFVMDESILSFRPNVVFTGTGDQTIARTNGTIVASTGTWSSTKASGNLTFTTYSGRNSSDELTWSSGSVSASSDQIFNRIYITGGTFTLTGSTTITDNFHLNGGTFVAAPSATTTFQSTFTYSSGTFTHNSGNVAFEAVSTSYTVTAPNVTFYNLAIFKSQSSSFPAVSLANSFTVANNLQIYNFSTTETFTVNGTSSVYPVITVQGDLILPDKTNATAMNLGSATAANNFNLKVYGNLNWTEGNMTMYASTTFTGSGNQTITKTGGTINSASTWMVDKSGGVATLASTIAHPSTFTLREGFFDIAGNSFTAATAFNIEDGGTLRLQGGETSLTSPTFGSGSTTVMYTGSSSYTGLKAGNSYYNLMFNGSGTWTMNATLDVNSNLEIVNGALATGGSAITLAGNWGNSGTFTHGNGTVTFDGTSQTIFGSAATTFYNFIKSVSSAATLTFPTSVTTTISNNTTLTGQSGSLLSLRSSSSGSQSSVNISNSGTRSITYVDVKDQNNTNSTAVSCFTTCTNSLNDTNWLFSMQITTDAASSVSGTTATLNSTISDYGNLDATQHGFALGTSAILASDTSTSTLGTFSGNGSFSEDRTSLSCNTIYYFRAYTTNSGGTWFGDIKTFTTTSSCSTTTSNPSVSTGSGGSGFIKSPQGDVGGQTNSKNPHITPSPAQEPSFLINPVPSPNSLTPPLDPNKIPTTTEATSTPLVDVTVQSEVERIADITDFVIGTIINIVGFIRNTAHTISSAITNVVEAITNTTTGTVLVQGLVGSGMIIGVVSGALTTGAGTVSISDILLSLNRMWGILLTGLGFRKRNPKWGVVYDSKTMQPIDPAIVTVYDQNGKEVANSITDIDGRYGFLLNPGTYTITVAKTNYIFPSKELVGKTTDGLHENLYFGNIFTVDSPESVVKFDIPMDAQKFDWNEYIKHEQKLTEFYEPHDRLIKRLSLGLFIVGFILSLALLISSPHTVNIFVFIMYSISCAILALSHHARPFGFVVSSTTKEKIIGARISIYLPDGETLIAQKTTDKFGRYYCLVQKGNYFMKVEMQNEDGSYALTQNIGLIKVRNGIIKKDIEV